MEPVGQIPAQIRSLKELLDTFSLQTNDILDDNTRSQISNLLQHTIDNVLNIISNLQIPVNYNAPAQHSSKKDDESLKLLNICSEEPDFIIKRPWITSSISKWEVQSKVQNGTGIFDTVFRIDDRQTRAPGSKLISDCWSNQHLELFLNRIRTIHPRNNFLNQTNLYLPRREFELVENIKMTTSNDSPILKFHSNNREIERKFDELYLDRYPNYDRNICVVDRKYILYISSNRVIFADCRDLITKRNISTAPTGLPSQPATAIFFNEEERTLFVVFEDGRYFVYSIPHKIKNKSPNFEDDIGMIAHGRFSRQQKEKFSSVCGAEGIIAGSSFDHETDRVCLVVQNFNEPENVASVSFNSSKPIHYMQQVAVEDCKYLMTCDASGTIRVFILHGSSIIHCEKEPISCLDQIFSLQSRGLYKLNRFDGSLETRNEKRELLKKFKQTPPDQPEQDPWQRHHYINPELEFFDMQEIQWPQQRPPNPMMAQFENVVNLRN